MNAAIQLYTVRELEESVPAIIERVADAGYDGVEFAYRVTEADTDEVVEALSDTGVEAAAAHVGRDALEGNFDETADLCETLGCQHVVVPGLADAYFASEEGVTAAAAVLEWFAARLSERDIDLHYHNHDHEFVDLDGTWAYERLIEETDESVGFELDVAWAQSGGEDPAALLDRYADRIELIHVTDIDLDSGRQVRVGDGDVDIEACIDAAREADVEWAIYENDEPEDLAEEIDYGGRTLRELLNG